jgi:hypothetical protein
MTENIAENIDKLKICNNGGIENDNQYLKFIYKKYTDYIINLEKHILTIYHDMVINIYDRNVILQELNTMVREMIKIFNVKLLKNYK